MPYAAFFRVRVHGTGTMVGCVLMMSRLTLAKVALFEVWTQLVLSVTTTWQVAVPLCGCAVT